MRRHKLCLLLLFYIITLSKTQDAGDSEAPCLMDKRYKSFHKYEYLYEAESLNALNGAVNGPRVSCKVELKVPDPCSYIMHTSECTVSEVTHVSADEKPAFGSAAGTENFRAAMEMYPLKFTVERGNDIKLFPEKEELVNILNIKRGIVSALAVPLLEEEMTKDTPTIYGLCKTDYIVKSREKMATDVTLYRDLSKCDKFRPVKDHTSPLALITGMHFPLAQLIKSAQTCNYKFDSEKHHMTSGLCTERHLFVPFSHKGEFGVTNIGKQNVTFLGVTKHNDRVFNHNVANRKPLHPDSSVDMSPVQNKEEALAVVKELAQLSKSKDGHRRAHLAHKLIGTIRRMNAETLAAAIDEALEISQALTYQALLQCGTPACNRVIMGVFRTLDRSSAEIDAAVYALGLVPCPSRVLVKEMLEMAKFKPSKPIYYAVSNAVKRLYEAEGITREIQSVGAHVLEQIGDCTGDQEHIFLSLRVIGNMAVAMEAANPALMSAVVRCINQPVASPAVQRAAIQVYRQIPIPDQGREVLMHVILDRDAVVQKRVAAYLILMKNPTSAELSQVAKALNTEKDLQTKSFITSHMSNILSSRAPETLQLRQKILWAFQSNKVGMLMDLIKCSCFYKIGSLEGNMIFDPLTELPRELMLEMTLDAFGFDIDLFEIGMEGNGFEPFVEALFGVDGFFPDTVMKTIYFAANKMPFQLNDVLNDIVPVLRHDRRRQMTQNIVQEIRQNVNTLFRELKAQDSPEALVYIRLLGVELGYLQTKDMEKMVNSAGKMFENLLKMLQKDFRSLFSSMDNDLFLHYIFMDNEFYLPTGSGFPLRLSLSGILTPGVKGGLSFNPNMGEFAFMPSVGIEFVTEVGAHFPDYVHSGLKMHTNIYHESSVKAKLSVRNRQVKLTFPPPQDPTKIISITNSLVSVVGGTSETIPPIGERAEVECSRFFPGLKYCAVLQYSDAMLNDAAPYFPLNGDSKFAIELHSTGEVTEYTTTISYEYEDNTDRVTVDLKAEGTSYQATAILKLNRQTAAASAEFLAPFLHVESKVSANIVKRPEEISLELESDLKLPETSWAQKLILKYDGETIKAKANSDFSSEIHNIICNSNVEAMINSLLDYQILKNKMKIRDVLKKSVKGLRAPVISFPKRLFLNVEGAAKYTFGKHYKTMTRQSTNAIVIPEIGTVEVSGKLNSNFYNLEAAVSAERNAVAHTSYTANAEVTGTSSVDLLSLKVKGTAVIESTPDGSFRANVKTTVNHKLVNVSVSVAEEVKLDEKIRLKSNSKLDVTSPLWVQISLEHTGHVEANVEEISGDGNLEGFVKAGLSRTTGTLTQSVSILPFKSEVNIHTSLKTDSTLQARNTISAAFTNGGLSIQSNTAAFEDLFSNIVELNFGESQLALKSSTKSTVFGVKIQNTAEARAGAKAASVKIDTSANLSEEQFYSQFSGTLDNNGLTVNSDASAKLIGYTAAHKANLTINKDGLSSSGTASLKSFWPVEELQHTFEISYKNLTLNGKCRTTGGIMSTQLTHNTELEIVGLAGSFKNQMRCSMDGSHFETTSHGTVAPFRINVDASAGAQGFLDLYGPQRVQINTKAHLKAEPFAIAHSHSCRVSTMLHINRVSIQSKLNNKFDIMLSPVEQNATLNVEIKVNNYAINNKLSTYNNPERLGLEGSGSIASGLSNTQNLSISGFLKYDKKSDGQFTSLPIFASLQAALEDIRIALVRNVEVLRNYINRDDVAAKIQNLPQHVNSVVSGLNIEGRVVQLKQNLLALTQNMPEYILTLEDLEDSLTNLRDGTDMLMMEVAHQFSEELDILKQLMVQRVLFDNVVENFNAVFSAIEEVKRVSVYAVKQLLIELDVIRNANTIYGIAKYILFMSNGKIATVLDETVEHIKQFKTHETILVVLAQNIQSVHIQITKFLDDTLTYLKTNEARHIIEISIPAKPSIPAQTSYIGFRKLHGEISVNSPVYSIRTSGDIQDASDEHPRFTATVSSQGTSPYDVNKNYNLAFTAQMSITERSLLKVSETLKIIGFLFCDQQVNMTLIKASPKQNSKSGTSHSEVNTALFSIEAGTPYSFETDYNHQVSVPMLFLYSDVTLNQKAIAYQEGATFILKVTNEGSGKLVLYRFSDESTHKCNLNFNLDLSTAKMTLTSHTESRTIKVKMEASANAVPQGRLSFEAHVKTESPFIENSNMVASGKASLVDMKVDFKAAHGTKLAGDVSGFLANSVNILASPADVKIDLQNKGEIRLNGLISILIELQNDYFISLNPETQQINVVALARFHHYYYNYKFAVINNEAEMGVYTAVDGVLSPSFVFDQVSYVPVLGFEIPSVKDLIFEQTDHWDTFVSTDQAIDLRAKLVYQKNKIPIPLGITVSKISFKSSVFELNANAGVYSEENVVMRVNALTTSVFEGLRVKLNGTTSVATKDGLRVSTSLSFDNVHIGGSHDGSLTLDVANYEAGMSADTTVKINLPTFSVNATHRLSGDSKTHPKSTSALKVEYSFDDPDSIGVGHGDAENNLKMEATPSLISIESVTKGATDSTFAETLINGTLENEAIVSVSTDGLWSSLKTSGSGIIARNYGLKIYYKYNINDSLTCKGDLGHVYLESEVDSNYEIDSKRETVKINHTALGKSDIVPLSSLLTAVGIILSHPQAHNNHNGDLEIIWLDRGIKCISKVVYPGYNSSLELLAMSTNTAPEVKFVFEGSYNLTGPSALVEYKFGIHGLKIYHMDYKR